MPAMINIGANVAPGEASLNHIAEVAVRTGATVGNAIEAGATRAAGAMELLGKKGEAFGLPLLVSVSRKSFLKALPGSREEAGVAAELFAVAQGADFIRTHDPGALREGLGILEAIDGRD